jgi:UDP-N-acetylglucosamine--N-acetylmuramyl-(pentapeptide) pyrophosphoryl-undecaprenol N-acetylglucosamine transferase
MEKFFPKEKIILTGNPIRQDLKNLDEKKDEAFQYFGLNKSKKTILIIGGSLGARTINEAIEKGLEKFLAQDVQLIWQTGKSFYKQASESGNKLNTPNFLVFDFVSRMDLAYAIANVVISRAGASSVSELCNLGLPCILVPSPNVAEDHQTKNAMALVEKNAAVLVKDFEAHQSLVIKTIELLASEKTLNDLRVNIKTLAFPDSAMVIANEVIKLAKKN